MKVINKVLPIIIALLALTGCQFKNETDMNTQTSINNKQKVRDFFLALEKEDAELVASLFHENAKHINPYASGIFPDGANGRDEIKNYWEPVFPNFDGMQFIIDKIYAMEDPSMVYVKYKGKIKLKGEGYYENDYYSTFKFDENGLITEYVEIFNPIVAAKSFGLINQIQ